MREDGANEEHRKRGKGAKKGTSSVYMKRKYKEKYGRGINKNHPVRNQPGGAARAQFMEGGRQAKNGRMWKSHRR